jgi:hypothetical protein
MKTKMRKNFFLEKRAKVHILMDQYIFIVIVALFFTVLFLFIQRSGTNSSTLENLYAKEISLEIDKASSGMNLSMNLSELYKKSKKNGYEGDIVRIDNKNNLITINLASGKGYSYRFFREQDVSWKVDEKEERLYIYIT